MKHKSSALGLAAMALSVGLFSLGATPVSAQLISSKNLADTKDQAVSLADDLAGSDDAVSAPIRAVAVARVEPVASPPQPVSGRQGEVLVLKKTFVILDFSESAVPSLGSDLAVYRGTEKVGAVHITKPIKPPLAAAEIIQGNLQRGDIVR